MKNYFILGSVFLGSSMLVTEMNMTGSPAISHKRNLPGDKGPVGTVSIVIDKSDYELSVYDDKG